MRDATLGNRQDDLPDLQLERPRIVQFPHPNPRVPQPEPPIVQSVEQEAGDPFIGFRLGWIIAILLGVALSVAFLLWASGYIIRKGHREIGVPEPAPITTVAESPTIPVTADLLHLSAITLGKIRMAVVNGEQLREGDSLRVKTPVGEAVLRVTQIEDGTVRFKYGAQTIDVRISTGRMH